MSKAAQLGGFKLYVLRCNCFSFILFLYVYFALDTGDDYTWQEDVIVIISFVIPYLHVKYCKYSLRLLLFFHYSEVYGVPRYVRSLKFKKEPTFRIIKVQIQEDG